MPRSASALDRLMWPMAVLASLAVAGCRDEPAGPDIVGAWRELPVALGLRPGSPMVATTDAARREFVFDSSGRFRLTVCDLEGRPVDPPEYVTGRWRRRGGTLALRIDEVRLPPLRAGWVPEAVLGLQAGDAARPDTLDLRGRDGVRVRCERAPAGGPEPDVRMSRIP